MRSMSEPGRLEEGIHEWDRLMEAIEAGNANAAAKAMGEHLAAARKAVVAKLQQEEQAAADSAAAAAAVVPTRRSG
jgi:DNA-binding GntR family transcriptional regulator